MLLDAAARRLLRPMRVGIAAFEQMLADFVQPLRVELGCGAREQLTGLYELESHHPSWRLLGQRGRRVQSEARLFRADIIARLRVPLSDLGQQAAQQRAMQSPFEVALCSAGGAALRLIDAQLLGHLLQLAMHLAPLTHANE